MEGSMISGNNNLGRSDYSSSDQDESSWTVYIEDFEEGKFHDDDDSSSLSDGCDRSSSSMVSDAASSEKKKQQIGDGNLRLNVPSTRVSSKRRRADRYASVDPDLEDTASSPAQSSKVMDLNQFIDNSSAEMNEMGIFQAQQECYYNLFKFQKQEDSRKNQLQESSLSISQQQAVMKNYTNELRRKGLCLVPLCMLFPSTTTTAAS